MPVARSRPTWPDDGRTERNYIMQNRECEMQEAKCGIPVEDVSNALEILKPETVGELTVTVELENLERLQHLLKVKTKKAKKLRKAIREINELEACTDDDLIINQKIFDINRGSAQDKATEKANRLAKLLLEASQIISSLSGESAEIKPGMKINLQQI